MSLRGEGGLFFIEKSGTRFNQKRKRKMGRHNFFSPDPRLHTHRTISYRFFFSFRTIFFTQTFFCTYIFQFDFFSSPLEILINTQQIFNHGVLFSLLFDYAFFQHFTVVRLRSTTAIFISTATAHGYCMRRKHEPSTTNNLVLPYMKKRQIESTFTKWIKIELNASILPENLNFAIKDEKTTFLSKVALAAPDEQLVIKITAIWTIFQSVLRPGVHMRFGH